MLGKELPSGCSARRQGAAAAASSRSSEEAGRPEMQVWWLPGGLQTSEQGGRPDEQLWSPPLGLQEGKQDLGRAAAATSPRPPEMQFGCRRVARSFAASSGAAVRTKGAVARRCRLPVARLALVKLPRMQVKLPHTQVRPGPTRLGPPVTHFRKN